MHRRLLMQGALGLTLPAAAQPTRPATEEPVPTAVIADSSFAAGPAAGSFFLLVEVDGEPVADDAARASQRASRGRGRTMVLAPMSRPVAAGRRRLKVVARTAYSAPIEALFRNPGEALEATFEVDLKPGVHYSVAGVLDAFRREVWIEETETRALATARRTDEAAAQSAEMAGAAYTCCNLHYEGDWISDANYVTLPMIPAGARIVVKDYGHHRVHVLINGRPMRIGIDFGRERETREQFVAKLIVPEDPRKRLVAYGPVMRTAIERGRIALGMTREQVLMALGYPRTDLTPSLQAIRWRYVTHQNDEYAIVWGEDERVRSVEAWPEGVQALVLHTPE